MKNAPQLPQPIDPDMVLLFLGSLLATLHHVPERDDAMLDAVATQITMDERPKTLLGLAVTACAPCDRQCDAYRLRLLGRPILSPTRQ